MKTVSFVLTARRLRGYISLSVILRSRRPPSRSAMQRKEKYPVRPNYFC